MDVRSGIENTLARYSHYLDLGDPTQLGACFTQDAEVTFNNGLKVGQEDVVQELVRRRGVYAAGTRPWHTITNVLIEGDGSGGVAFSKAFFTMILLIDGQELRVTSAGYYDDEFREDGGTWRVHRRTVVSVASVPR